MFLGEIIFILEGDDLFLPVSHLQEGSSSWNIGLTNMLTQTSPSFYSHCAEYSTEFYQVVVI